MINAFVQLVLTDPCCTQHRNSTPHSLISLPAFQKACTSVFMVTTSIWHYFSCNFPRLLFFYMLHTSVITCICFTAYHNEFILSFASSSCLRLMTLITYMLCKDDLEVMIWVELKHRFPPYHTYKSNHMLS